MRAESWGLETGLVRRIAKVGDAIDLEDMAVPSGPRCATIAGFNVHADVCIPALDRMQRERLCRYAGRPPVATERLSLLPGGRLLYRLKRRWRDGTTHMIFQPIELVDILDGWMQPPLETRQIGFVPAKKQKSRISNCLRTPR